MLKDKERVRKRVVINSHCKTVIQLDEGRANENIHNFIVFVFKRVVLII